MIKVIVIEVGNPRINFHDPPRRIREADNPSIKKRTCNISNEKRRREIHVVFINGKKRTLHFISYS